MSKLFGIVTAEHCYLRRAPGSSEMENRSGIEDEIFSGWAVRLIPEERTEACKDSGKNENREAVGYGFVESGEDACEAYAGQNGWVKVETHYGYRGYVSMSELRLADREELQKRQDKSRFVHMGISEADLLSYADIQALPLELILRNAVVEVLDVPHPEGWIQIRTAAGREGYVHDRYLTERKDDDWYLLETKVIQNNAGDSVADGIVENHSCEATAGPEYFRKRRQNMNLDETAFRCGLIKSALSYLGTQYRWGGKSSQGIDCSGLVFMSYLENGILIFRDSRIEPGYPMKEISAENLKPGDAIYFPGHVAMYMGDGKYIHSTAYIETPCVTINSLNPGDREYRGDLVEKIVAYGSIFP